MTAIYRVFAYFGLATFYGALFHGFRYDASAPAGNLGFNIGLYAIFALPHLVMTRSWFKQRVWGKPEGSAAERRVYIFVTVVMWVVVYALHRPIPGPAFALPEWVRFIGMCGLVLSTVAFFEGITFAMIDGLLGVPGSAMSHSHGEETPLLTEGSYARVRHPMYRAATCAALASMVVHPHAGQMLWGTLLALTFLLFIPIEERQLRQARGEAYMEYCRTTRYRVFRGLW